MLYLQVLANGIVLGGLYACIAVGFSLVWGVLNVINILHGSFIVLGGYLAFFAYRLAGIHPFLSVLIAAPLFFALGYALQRGLINRMIAAPVLLTLTLTFGLDLMLSNAMLSAFTADFRKITLDPPLGTLFLGPVVLPVDRLMAMGLAGFINIAMLVVAVIWRRTAGIADIKIGASDSTGDASGAGGVNASLRIGTS